MPVFFYIDPDFMNDPAMEKVDNIVLSYTFFEAKQGLKLPYPGYAQQWICTITENKHFQSSQFVVSVLLDTQSQETVMEVTFGISQNNESGFYFQLINFIRGNSSIFSVRDDTPSIIGSAIICAIIL